jgi:hypothetical protein
MQRPSSTASCHGCGADRASAFQNASRYLRRHSCLFLWLEPQATDRDLSAAAARARSVRVNLQTRAVASFLKGKAPPLAARPLSMLVLFQRLGVALRASVQRAGDSNKHSLNEPSRATGQKLTRLYTPTAAIAVHDTSGFPRWIRFLPIVINWPHAADLLLQKADPLPKLFA